MTVQRTKAELEVGCSTVKRKNDVISSDLWLLILRSRIIRWNGSRPLQESEEVVGVDDSQFNLTLP
jgi:hypothetical protein